MLLKTITCLGKIDELQKTNQQLHFGRTFGCCYGQKFSTLPGPVRNTHAMFLCLVEIILLV